MMYKQLPKVDLGDPDEQPIYARVDDDGKIRVTCTAKNPDFLEWLAQGNTPEPADEAPE